MGPSRVVGMVALSMNREEHRLALGLAVSPNGLVQVVEQQSPAPSNSAMPESASNEKDKKPELRSLGVNGSIARCGNGGLVYVSKGAETCAGFGGVAEWFVPLAQRSESAAVPATNTEAALGSPSKWRSFFEVLGAVGVGVAAGLSNAPAVGFQPTPGLLLFGARGHDVYLGCLNCSPFASDSICNDFGKFGNPFSNDSIWQPFARFGNRFGAESPWNAYAAYPPVIVDREGNFYGYFTSNNAHPKRTTIASFAAVLDFARGS